MFHFSDHLLRGITRSSSRLRVLMRGNQPVLSVCSIVMDTFRSTFTHQQVLIELRLSAIALWPIMCWLKFEVSHGFPKPLSRIQCWRTHWRRLIKCPAMLHQLEKSRAKHFGHNRMAYLDHHSSEGWSSGVRYGCLSQALWLMVQKSRASQARFGEGTTESWNCLSKPTDLTASCYCKVAYCCSRCCTCSV